jgi:ADP-heptose:LPS heptosyltransferase
MHLAAAAGVPCVALFGKHNTPRKWHPYGAGHRVIHETGGIGLIAPERVEVAIRDMLAATADGILGAGRAP